MNALIGIMLFGLVIHSLWVEDKLKKISKQLEEKQ